MNKQKCPLCGSVCNIGFDNTNPTLSLIRCNEIDIPFLLNVNVRSNDEKEFRKRCNMICEFLLKKPYIEMNEQDCCYSFYYDSSSNQISDDPKFINVFELMNDYPKNIGEKLNRIILNISRKVPNIGELFVFNALAKSLIFMETDDENERNALMNFLDDRDLILIDEEGGNSSIYKLTAKAWELIAEQTKKQIERNQGFIAMEISDRTEAINECFKKAINACGYSSKRIDQKEHNNQIVPEIFYEIEQSKFVVVDVTYQNYGAYYEAGYAQALKKQVIICCRKSEFNDSNKEPHFDIAQKNMIVWADENELIERLKNESKQRLA